MMGNKLTPQLNDQPPSVLELLRERSRRKSLRGSRGDPYHLAIVIECGGMRGVVAGGFIQALCSRGISTVIDTVHGSSAGACAGAYLLSNQPQEGSRIYDQDICNRQVVNPWRLLSHPCMVDTDFIVDRIIDRRRKLDATEIISHPGLLNIITTVASDGSPEVHNHFRDRSELMLALKATLRVPGPREPGIEIGGKRHLDGGLVAPIPIFSAIRSGATHLLVLAAGGATEYSQSFWGYRIEAAVLHVIYGAALAENYRRANRVNRLHQLNELGSSVTSDVLMRREPATRCSWYTIDKAVLRASEAEAKASAEAYLSGR